MTLCKSIAFLKTNTKKHRNHEERFAQKELEHGGSTVACVPTTNPLDKT